MSDQPVVIVSGGGSGMGADAARKLAADGWRVAVMSSSGKGEALGRELGGIGRTGSNRSVDDLQALVDDTMAAWGRIDAVVNSAGHAARGPVLEIADEDWHAGMEIYLLNVVRLARMVTPIMAGQGGGSIVNISTFATFEPDAAFPLSGIFRSGLAAFTKLFVDEHAASNVRMNNVLPGFIDNFPVAETNLSRIPAGRYGKVAEVSELIAFLASERSAYVTGQNIRIDGALTRSV
jgi:NAD(P)-dependent dehydrogenase (short-subunit alcohol dehydrogenase family)